MVNVNIVDGLTDDEIREIEGLGFIWSRCRSDLEYNYYVFEEDMQ